MKAVIFETPDTPCCIREIKTPKINDDQVLIQLQAASLNRRDYWIKKGIYQGSKYPCIAGSDGSGIVEKTGKNVDSGWIGKDVIINPGLKWGSDPLFHSPDFRILGVPDQGTLAQYIAVDAENVYPKPQGWTYEKAAALPLAGLTAYRALFTRGGLLEGEDILITGAGGGVSTLLIKFAVAAGARVFVTSGNEKKIKKAVSLGAISGVNYQTKGWDKELYKFSEQGFDLILDSAAGDNFALLPSLLKLGGRIVIFGGTTGMITNLTAAKIFWKQASILGTTMGSQEDFQKMIEFVESNKIQPEIDKIFPMVDTELAFKHMENQEQFGKIVIRI
jgi:zinc-binding alcohol dehydrogenase/oxidoreductase